MDQQHFVLYKRQCLLFNSIHYWEDTTVEVSMEVSRFKFKLYFTFVLFWNTRDNFVTNIIAF